MLRPYAGAVGVKTGAAAGLAALAMVAGGIMTGNAAAHAAPPPQPEIPVTLLTSETGSYLPRVEVSINGSDPIPMMIDTGTNFMVVFPGAIQNPTEPVFDTGIAQGIDYDGSSASGTIARARVEVGGVVSTPGDVAFLDATSCTPHCLGYLDDIGGVIGIGQRLADAHNEGDPANDLFSPLAQLSEEQSVGFTVDFTAGNPVIRVGKPTDAGETDTVLQRTQDGDRFYPTGQPVFDEPEVCWTVTDGGDHAKACNDTVFDTGQSTGMIRGDQFKPVIDPVHSTPEPGSGALLLGWVKTGATVSWATSSSSEPYAEIEEPGVNPYRYGLYSSDANETFNAGNGFYLKHTIGFDNTTGEVVISATAGTPTGPADVHADSGMESLTAHWKAPANTGGSAISHYSIRVTPLGDGDPIVVKADADATRKTVDGLVAGQAYWVSVAAVNQYGVGQRVRAADPVVPTASAGSATPTPTATASPALANTGDGAVPGTIAGVLLLAGAGAGLLLLRRRSRRA
jgi:LPXTG-motif cell wall-anchored protein